ncbi:hypothetical protein IFM89_034326 [Coptis chinensis]|uniref:Uncharacterized protein n=1 Tax=Coptis chinensis TaxID=261450 RepID=A0A835IFV2_9MAGN|nr:hypothetical protein IFM89_034326 [Coptis chinensis]
MNDRLIACKARSPLTKDIWSATSIACLVAICKTRNKILYEDGRINEAHIRIQVKKSIKRAHEQTFHSMDNTTQDLATLHALYLSNKLRRAPMQGV